MNPRAAALYVCAHSHDTAEQAEAAIARVLPLVLTTAELRRALGRRDSDE